jgi:hypothetical protein
MTFKVIASGRETGRVIEEQKAESFAEVDMILADYSQRFNHYRVEFTYEIENFT